MLAGNAVVVEMLLKSVELHMSCGLRALMLPVQARGSRQESHAQGWGGLRDSLPGSNVVDLYGAIGGSAGSSLATATLLFNLHPHTLLYSIL